ncbi:MAG: PilZ domain-containing protein [Desulfobulbus sp.]|nr:MAG: PilZ domain-containing protein [Desulfobulbus sp.]
MTGPTREKITAGEAEIMDLAKAGQRDQAREKLIELTIACAQGGDLNNANRLRDLLYEVDPMALREIIKVNEIIEQAMSGSVDENFQRAWTGLREALSQEEFLGLYHALEMHEVAHGKTVVQLGSGLDAIFLLNKGNINVVCRSGDKNVACKVLEPGALISENCFQPSLWTVALVTLSPASLGVLRLERLVDLESRFPGIESRLRAFAEKCHDIPKCIREHDLDRRRFPRFRADSKLTFQVLNKDNKPDERAFKGELHSISQGGLAFLLRIVKKENRRMLFGRRLLITVQQGSGSGRFSGTVVAVTLHDPQEHDYSIHLAFPQPIPEDVIRPLVLPDLEPLEEYAPEEQLEQEPDSESSARNEEPKPDM